MFRRRKLPVYLSLLFGCACAANCANSESWPLFRGNPQSTGTIQGTLPEKLDELWRFEVKGGAFEGTAAIVDGVVYLGDLDGAIRAWDLATGKLRWEKKTDQEGKPYSGFIASPAVRDGLLFLGDMDGKFYCFDAKTGEQRWLFMAGAEIDSCANFYQDKVLVGSQDATLYCLEADSGQVAWKFTIGDQIRCTPTVVENRAFVAGCDGKLHVIDLDKGNEVAGVEIDAPTGVTPAVLGDFVYFGTEGGVVFGVNWKEAKTIWTYKPDKGSQAFRSSPAVTKSAVVIGGRNKQVHCLQPETGKVLWTFPTKQRVDSSPIIAGDRVFVGSADGRFYVINLQSGEKVWEYEAKGSFNSSPAVADGRLVIASDDGVVYCFGRK